jgi:DNA-binding transcriptional ArsR family regulator
MEPAPDLVQFFKALADENRLKIVGLLASESYSGEVLAQLLKLSPATVSHHLTKLAEAGLVTARMQGHSKLYSLRTEALHAMANSLLSREPRHWPPQATRDLDLPAYDRKVLNDYLLPDGSLKKIPAQQKKLLALLRHMLKDFEPGQIYPEKRVNAILGRFHPDTASLRRAMIEYKFMQREAGRYWR